MNNIIDHIDADKLLLQMKKEFLQKTGKDLNAELLKKQLTYMKVDMEQLFDICNTFIPKRYLPFNIRRSTQKREIVYIRDCFCAIGYTAGYSQQTLGDFLGKDRSTIYHSLEKVTNAVSHPTTNPQLHNLYQKVVQKVQNEISIQRNHESQLNSQPGLLAVLDPLRTNAIKYKRTSGAS